tara:strand:+ start:849 stop:1289 length:441 start_codon:yes stop_codon:yes gene_type:complete
MKNQELKKALKPLIKQCIKEVIFEEGVLSGIISEVVKGVGAQSPIVESKPREPKRPRPDDSRLLKEREETKRKQLRETRKKMLDAIGGEAFNGVDLFEGTSALSKAGDVSEGATPSSPLSNYSAEDPGVNIAGLLSVAGNAWKKLI